MRTLIKPRTLGSHTFAFLHLRLLLKVEIGFVHSSFLLLCILPFLCCLLESCLLPNGLLDQFVLSVKLIRPLGLILRFFDEKVFLNSFCRLLVQQFSFLLSDDTLLVSV